MKEKRENSKAKNTKRKKRRGTLNRRQFLGLGALGAATAASAAVPLSKDNTYDARHPKVAANHADLPANGKSVVIIGGGLAGLQAGVELAARGFKVEVLEKSGTPGGKLKTWRDKNFGPKDHPLKKDPKFKGFVREHGVHAIWGFYKNLREFMGRYNFPLDDYIPDGYSIYNFRDKDGTKSSIPMATSRPPYNRIEQAKHFLNLNLVEEGEGAALLNTTLDLFTFDYTDRKQREYLDSMTFAEYGKKKGLSPNAIHKFYDSVIEMAYFDNVEHCSALTVGLLMQSIAGSYDDLKVNLYGSPPGETFLGPMAEFIEKKGGKVRYNTEVTDITFKDNQIESVIASLVTQSQVRRCQICGELIVGNDHHDDCPFCGAHGENLKTLTAAEKSERTFRADYYISALDVPAARKFVAKNFASLQGAAKAKSNYKYFPNIMGLSSTEVYVVNLWFEGRDFWKKEFASQQGFDTNFFATGFDHLGITMNWSMKKENDFGEYKTLLKEYNDYDVSIIETQIAKVDLVRDLPDEEIAAKVYGELKTIIGDLPDYQDFYVNKWRNYTRYLPGDEARRPDIQSPIDNLLFIGDMAFVPHACVFMEKTNVTAKWAANLIMDKAGQKEGKIRILKSGTPSKLVGLVDLVKSVYI